MAHTPGKWELAEGIDEYGNWEASVFCGETGTVCRCDDEMADYKANAALIAAAPDLLEALKRMVNLDFYPHGSNPGDCLSMCPVCQALDNAQAVIAKAEGRN